MPLSALIFDVDGTLAETEDAHRDAFNATFAEFGRPWHWDRTLYRKLLKVAGGRARIRYFLDGHHPDVDLSDVDIAAMHKCKTAIFQERLRSGRVPLRPGVERLMREARAEGLRLAIATTTSPGNVKALITSNLGEEAMDWFDVIGDGSSVDRLKPDPAVYLWVLEKLGLDAGECLALEDSGNGLKACLAAEIPVLITVAMYTDHEDFTGATKVVDGLDQAGVDVAKLRVWHSGA